MTNVVIADGKEIVRSGLAAYLTQHTSAVVVAETSDGYSTLKACKAAEIDVLLLDFDITRPNIRETIAKLRSSSPHVRILVMSNNGTALDAMSVLALGAVGYISKNARGVDFANGVNSVAGDYTYVPAEFLSEFVSTRRNFTRTGNLYGLSPREMEILDATISGRGTKEIADQLGISVRTVETHRNRMYKKTNCASISDLVELGSG
jgi:DNA-binding NarL/FixJ family response regulator